MRALTDLFDYNAWANAQVFATCASVDQARLDAEAPGTYGSIADTLKHQVQVEVVYARMLRGEPLGVNGSSDDFFAHDLAWYAEVAARTAGEFSALLANASEAFYDEPLHVPWFDFALTKRDGLLQALTHSAQHRAQVFSILGQHGVEVPNLDYVFFVGTRHGKGA